MAVAAGFSAAAEAGKAGIDFVKNVIDEAKGTIIIENGTDFTFTHLRTVPESGAIKKQLPPKLSKGRYVMETMRKSRSLKGTNGIVTLQIDDTCFAVAIVWCVPTIGGGNRFAIGVYAPRDVSDPQKIVNMVRKYQEKPTAFQEYASLDYKDSKDGITNVRLDHVVKIMANMNNRKPGRVMIQISETATELRVVHKYPRTATGSYGTLSYFIKELNCRVVLMWSLPFNHDFFSNWLALDIKCERDLDHSRLFDMMYNRKDVVRKKYDKEFSKTCLSGDGVTLNASMTPSHRSHIEFKIELDEENQALSKF